MLPLDVVIQQEKIQKELLQKEGIKFGKRLMRGWEPRLRAFRDR
jgi:hypothetical protein